MERETDWRSDPAEVLRRQRFFEAANRAYAALRADPKAWSEELEERRLWEGTLMDGLEDDPYPLEEDQIPPAAVRNPE